MKLHRLKAVAWKEVLQIARDARSIGIVVAMPIVMMLVFGYGVSVDLKHLPVYCFDREGSQASQDLLKRFQASEYFQVVRSVDNYPAIVRALDEGTVQARRRHPARLLQAAERRPARKHTGADRRDGQQHREPGNRVQRGGSPGLFAAGPDELGLAPRANMGPGAAQRRREDMVQREPRKRSQHRAGRGGHRDGRHRDVPYGPHHRQGMGEGHDGAAYLYACDRPRIDARQAYALFCRRDARHLPVHGLRHLVVRRALPGELGRLLNELRPFPDSRPFPGIFHFGRGEDRSSRQARRRFW